jgi:hypothetical protein
MERIRSLTLKEKMDLELAYDNFEYLFRHRYFIIRDIEERLWKVKVFEEMNNTKDVIVYKTFRTLKQLKKGLEEITEQFA